jgi:hypothetical protein
MRFEWYGIHHLPRKAQPHTIGRHLREQTVIASTATSKTMSVTVKGHARHNHQANIIQADILLAHGLLNAKKATTRGAVVHMEAERAVRLRGRQKDYLSLTARLGKEQMRVHLVGQRMIQQYHMVGILY